MTLQGPDIGICHWDKGAELSAYRRFWPLGTHLSPIPVQLGAGDLLPPPQI